MRTCVMLVTLGILGVALLVVVSPRLWTRWTESPVPSEQEILARISFGPIVARAAEDDVEQLERSVCAAAHKVLPAVVAVGNPTPPPSKPGGYSSYYSGVIVTEGGIVLSQWHVSHWAQPSDGGIHPRSPTFSAGEKTTVILHDGRECPAELLGADRTRDLSLLRLLEPGPYPFAPIDAGNVAHLGDWVLKIGHPLGYRRGRSAPLRLGRVLSRIDEVFVSDCRTSGGDSGGPYFDLDGHLIGVVWGGDGFAERVVAKDDPLLALRTGTTFRATSCSAVNAVFDQMRSGEIVLDVGEEYPHENRRLDTVEHLRAEDWTEGRVTREMFREFVAPARKSVVAVLNEGVAVALGTVVAEGYVITKGSELPSKPLCLLPDGRTISAEVMGAEPAFDLALLKMETTGLSPITWSENCDPPVGKLLAAVSLGELPTAVGVVSARRYSPVDPGPPAYSLPLRLPAYRPALYGRPQYESGRGYFAVWQARGLAWSAGIRPTDLIRKVAGHDISTEEDLSVAVGERMSGDVVTVEIERDTDRLQLQLPLSAKPVLGLPEYSYRSDDFPTLIECDVPFLSFECGGPIVDRSGRAIGVSIARVADHGGMIIPGDCIQRLLPDFVSGKLARHWDAD